MFKTEFIKPVQVINTYYWIRPWQCFIVQLRCKCIWLNTKVQVNVQMIVAWCNTGPSFPFPFTRKIHLSWCVFLAVFMSWFANTVASNVLATSTTSRSVTFVCGVFLCLCPFPISFTRRASDVKPAINWSLISSSAKSSYSHCTAWLRTRVSQEAIDSFSFCRRRRNFCRSLDTPMLAP